MPQRTFRLMTPSTQVHEPERYMVYFEQIEPAPEPPFAVDPLLDFFSIEDAREVGILQFHQDIDQRFVVGDRLVVDPGSASIVKAAG